MRDRRAEGTLAARGRAEEARGGETFLSRYGIVLALLGLTAILSILSPLILGKQYFLTPKNLLHIGLQASVYAIIASGMTLVIISAGIDLSVGSIVALVGMVVADVLVRGWGIPAAVIIGMAAGSICGFVNGMLIVGIKLPSSIASFLDQFGFGQHILALLEKPLPPFIATLGTMSILRGLAYLYNQGRPIYGLPRYFMNTIAGDLGPIPVPFLITTLVAIVVTFLLDFTIIGRHIYATGGNLEAARLAGIDVDRSKVTVYSLCGLLSGLAAVVLTARMSAAEPIAAQMYELEAIAAAVMGGTSLVGGAGSIPGTVIGALIMSMLRNGMNLFNLQTYYQPVAIGAVIVLAVKVAPVRKEEA